MTTISPTDRVDVLLATYNGARFVDSQIQSILEEAGPGCRLLIRDDGSIDGTLSLVKRYTDRAAGKIVLLEDDRGHLGACGNFSALLSHASADYVVFCDHDDVWLPGRITKPLERIKALERQYGVDTPVLIHTDLVVTNENLHPLSSSFWEYSHLDPQRGGTLNRLLVQNVVTGCATTINGALARLAGPIPESALMHDWWLALVASAFGRLDFLAQPTVLYRQHARNTIGAKRFGLPSAIRQLANRLSARRQVQAVRSTFRQAEMFLRRFAKLLTPQQLAVVEAYVELGSHSFLQRRRTAIRYGLLKNDWIRNLTWLAFM